MSIVWSNQIQNTNNSFFRSNTESKIHKDNYVYQNIGLKYNCNKITTTKIKFPAKIKTTNKQTNVGSSEVHTQLIHTQFHFINL